MKFFMFSKYTKNNVIAITDDDNGIEAGFAFVVRGYGHNH